MKIKIETPVHANLERVKEGFTEDLFLKLNPPFPPVKLKRFDGCKTGDQVALELNFILFKQQWVSDIIKDFEDKQSWYFIDRGVRLPFFLQTWKHHHKVIKSEGGSIIIDDIEFTTGTLLSDMFFYPLLLGQFLYRKPIYKRIFS